jgi:hypothetical protein
MDRRTEQGRPRRALVAGMFLTAGLWGCNEITVPDSRPTQISLEADHLQRQVGQDFTFTYEGEGRSILGVVVLYGDGRVDSIPAFGSQTVGGRREHAYDAPGSYRVTIVMEDAGQRVVEAGVDVEVIPGPGGAP